MSNELKLNQMIRFKWITLGKATVGKTSLVTRFMQNQFNERIPTTIGAHFSSKTISMNGKSIKIESKFYLFVYCLAIFKLCVFFLFSFEIVWDTAGEERCAFEINLTNVSEKCKF